MLKQLAIAACSVLFASQLMAAPDAAHPHVLIDTDLGQIEVELDGKNAPISTENFLKYADRGFYAGTQFHRVIPGFMIQGGGYDKDMDEKQTGNPIINESSNGLRNDRGTIAMARTNAPNSATSQFYINVADNASLNGSIGHDGYAVFGKVVKGMDVVDRIVAVPTGNRGFMQNVPRDPVLIKGVKRLN